MQSARVGKQGAILVPANSRKKFGIEEARWLRRGEQDGILIRPESVVPVERYSPQRRVSFASPTRTMKPIIAVLAIRFEKGFDPNRIPHAKPS